MFGGGAKWKIEKNKKNFARFWRKQNGDGPRTRWAWATSRHRGRMRARWKDTCDYCYYCTRVRYDIQRVLKYSLVYVKPESGDRNNTNNVSYCARDVIGDQFWRYCYHLLPYRSRGPKFAQYTVMGTQARARKEKTPPPVVVFSFFILLDSRRVFTFFPPFSTTLPVA